ncbi:MAG: DNA-processing protein DprA [Clostridia bacterium]|nr:DNA-processing protein DprA [Clostridia bacterium]
MNKYWVWLSRIKELNFNTLQKILQKSKTIKNIWNMDKKELSKIEGLTKELIEEILNIEYRKNLQNYIYYMEKNNIKMINIFDKNYPLKLKNIYDPPIVLYIKGDETILNNIGLAIIGCRMCSKYGEMISKKFAKELQTFNVNIISGLARGIDSYAHIGCLDGKGKTIAVVGTGLDTVYPKENEILEKKIIESGGAIVSEYIVGTRPEKENFPKRNRIISGLADGVLVVEAKEKSGTFITVDFALEQGKNVFAIPGNILSNTSKGTNELIKQGAKIVTCVEDIIEEYI